MADIALDADGLRRDRERYAALLDQAEQQIAAWNERADHLQQALDGLDRLLALAGDDPAQDGGVPRGRTPGRDVAARPAAAASRHEAPARRAAPDNPRTVTKKAPSHASAVRPPPPMGTPSAPDPAEPPAGSAADAPKGTDALRTVFESAPARKWSLADLIEALEAKGWLPTSRRPEEGVRISLKRLAERGGVVRTEDGRWLLAGGDDAETSRTDDDDGSEARGASEGDGVWPPGEAPVALEAPSSAAAPPAEHPEAQPPPPPPDLPPARPASFGRPVGGTVTEV